MKHTLYLFLFLVALVTPQRALSQLFESQLPLKYRLWDFVDSCRETIYYEELGMDSYDSIVDDTNNGFLYISGSSGCGCSNAAAAFKTGKGDYILIKSEYWTCQWRAETVASTSLLVEKIFPKDISLQTFSKTPLNFNGKYSPFYLDLEIPRFGTSTKAVLSLVPYGINVKSQSGLCFAYEADEVAIDHYQLSEILILIKSNESLIRIMEDENITSTEREIIQKFQKMNDYPLVEIRRELHELFDIYKLYNQMSHTTLLLKWDKQQARFIITGKEGTIEKLSFFEFLKEKMSFYARL
ncbi:MAG: hypothetical protein OEW75_01745 [Cyclobacteriaceae bacterium]|nr:hypothetical protein [Cyclobacteriaceae bacterium]